MAISLPQIFRISFADKFSKSLPSKSNTTLLQFDFVLSVINPSPAEVTDLPLPDSPTKATVVLFLGIEMKFL